MLYFQWNKKTLNFTINILLTSLVFTMRLIGKNTTVELSKIEIYLFRFLLFV